MVEVMIDSPKGTYESDSKLRWPLPFYIHMITFLGTWRLFSGTHNPMTTIYDFFLPETSKKIISSFQQKKKNPLWKWVRFNDCHVQLMATAKKSHKIMSAIWVPRLPIIVTYDGNSGLHYSHKSTITCIINTLIFMPGVCCDFHEEWLELKLPVAFVDSLFNEPFPPLHYSSCQNSFPGKDDGCQEFGCVSWTQNLHSSSLAWNIFWTVLAPPCGWEWTTAAISWSSNKK